MSTHQHTEDSDIVIAAEEAHILQGREEAKVPGKKDEFTGLAFSGGGIRSASFCLGVLQALVKGRLMKKFDYLSTASGGGYLGASLTWFLKIGLPGGGTAGVDPENFPFGRAGTGARNQDENPNAILDFLRQHGCYLTPNNQLDFVSFAAYALRTILVSLLVYFSLTALLMLLLQCSGLLDSRPGVSPFTREYWSFHSNDLILLQAALVLLALFALASLVGGLFSRLARSYRLRIFNQEVLGMLLKLTGLCVLLGSLPVVKDLLDDYLNSSAHIGAAGGSTLIGTLIGWYRYYNQQKAARPKVEGGGGMTPIIASGLIIYGLALGAFILADAIYEHKGSWTYWFAAGALILSGPVFGWIVNINQFSLHRMYRDRLMETFMPDLKSVQENRWDMATEADKALLEDMCQAPNRRPYHLLNANLVLSDSLTAKYRGRGGDNFLLSPLYCGSDATGWRRSSAYMKKLGGRRGGLTLATAMAVSGAALNPNAGNSGRGVTRNPWVSILYTLLNLRLGYWVVNPCKEAGLKTANFLVPGLWQSVIGNVLNFGLNEKQPFLELTDGGHFDNLGIYELIRRRLKTIVVCDGGADEKFTFDDLANAIERVRVDFGARIQFKDPGFDLNGVLPGSAGDETTDVRYQTAKRGFAVASISYADGSEGLLIYIKATMIRGLSTDLYSYKAAHPKFPHEPTLDQFFDEVQIEAYRELGYYLGWQFLEANGANKQEGSPVKAPWI
jgi:hypothetical protein